MKEIETINEIKKIIFNFQKSLQDSSRGLTDYERYCTQAKAGNFDTEKHVDIFCKALFESLRLFPDCQHFCSFLNFTNDIGLMKKEKFVSKLFLFLDTELTEKKYPRRLFERATGITFLMQKPGYPLCTLHWIEETSKMALDSFDQWKCKVYYESGEKEKALSFLEGINNKKKFSQTTAFFIEDLVSTFGPKKTQEFLTRKKNQLNPDTFELFWRITQKK